MSFVGDFIGDVVGGVTGAKQAGEAGEAAARTQAELAAQGIEEQRRQFDAIVEMMRPYVEAGAGALTEQERLLGLRSPAGQKKAIRGIRQSPLFKSLVQQGENALLQQASATGGLRGGNIQGALAQFRPQMLQQAIQQQYGNLGGLASLGQASAGLQARQGAQASGDIANLLQQQGAALAGGQLAGGSLARNTFQDLLDIGGFVIPKTLGIF